MTTSSEFKQKLEQLRKTDPEKIKTREGGTDRRGGNSSRMSFEYLEWHYVADILDDVAPSWTHTVKDIRQIGDFVSVIVALSIDGVTREGLGTGKANEETGIKKAEHDALKRAAVKFGVGRDLYKKEERARERQQRQPGGGGGNGRRSSFDASRPPERIKFDNPANAHTSKQLDRIRNTAKRLEVDPDEVSRHFLKANINELTKDAASWLIDLMESPEFRSRSESSANVLSMPARSSAGGAAAAAAPAAPTSNHVSPDMTGRMLFEAGAVKAYGGGKFTVTRNAGGVNCDFSVAIDGNNFRCTCGDYKNNVRKDPDFRCADIVATQCYISARGSSSSNSEAATSA